MYFSIVGAVLIIAGLYLVVWGKSQESKFGKEIKVEANSMPVNIRDRMNSDSGNKQTALIFANVQFLDD